jgi:predicted xylose isomerase-like sugar epimerase
MSRAINVDASQDDVRALAAKHGVGISAIEPLHPRGTRVVFLNADDAAVIAKALSSKLLKGAVVRTPLRPARV